MLLKTRLFALLAALSLTAAPVLASPMLVPHGPAVAAPHSSPASPFDGVASWLTAAGIAVGITIRKDVGSIATKFVTRAQGATGDYKDGVQGAGNKWEQNTAAAEGNFEQGIQAAITDKRFSRGVQGQGGKFQQNAVALGSQRYGPGVANAKDAYAKGMGPVLSALSGINLPAKSFRGSPTNMNRANVVATTLAALRTGK